MAQVEVFMGAPIEHHSERITLLELVRAVSAMNRDGVIIANAELSGRQIDFILALDHATFVIECKTGHQPLRGGPNGNWQYQSAAGGWKDMPNPYRQALGEVNAVRDAMEAIVENAPYPFGLLVFSPELPAGSTVSGDFKVSVVGLKEVSGLLEWRKDTHWSLDNWRRFVGAHGFKRIDRLDAAYDASIASAESLFSDYRQAFLETYEKKSLELISYSCRDGDATIDLDDAILRASSGTNLLIIGPSGCGKTLAAYKIGVRAVKAGRLPILISGKFFDGSLGETIKAEVSLLGVPTWRDLLKSQQALDFPLQLIVDGYNECNPSLSERFTRGIAAMARRYSATVTLISQEGLGEQSLLTLKAIHLPSPDQATKNAIAARVTSELSPEVEALLKTISSGLEARLVGEVGGTLAPGSSRFALFDTYARKVLGRDASICIATMTQIAEALDKKVSFGMSVRELDRLAAQSNFSQHALDKACSSRFLEIRGDRMIFGHELFQNAFSAEAVIRTSTSATDILKALHSPQYRTRDALIVGAIDDERLLVEVLEGITSSNLLEECAAGVCGTLAKNVSQRLLLEALDRVSLEIDRLSCVLDKSALGGTRFEVSGDFDWTPQEHARLTAVTIRLRHGYEFEKVFSLIGKMDLLISNEAKRLREDAIAQDIAPRHGMFSNTYVFSGKTGIGSLCQPIHSGIGRVTKAAESQVLARLSAGGLSHGQLYVLLAMHRATDLDAPGIASILPNLIARHWAGAPYHLKLDILQAATFCGRDEDQAKAKLLNTLQELPTPEHIFLSTSMVEAMQSLGAFDDQEQEFLEMAQSDIREALADPRNPIMQTRANSAWNQQFDGPYSGAYCQALGELSSGDKKALLEMVASGAGQEDSFSNILMLELSHFNDPMVASLFFKWVELPPTRCVMPQDAIRNFVTAHIAAARLGADMPKPMPEVSTDAALTLQSCGLIFYWLNRIDIPFEERRKKCKSHLDQLLRHDLGVAAGVLCTIYNADFRFSDDGHYSLPGGESVCDCIGSQFPREVAEIARQCLLNPHIQRGFFDYFDRNDALQFSQNALGSWGERGDLLLLRSNANDRRLGFSALSAIERLESYLASPPDSPRPHFANARTIC